MGICKDAKSTEWREVSKQSPCPICDKPDWCGTTTDGAVRCMREQVAPPGWRIMKVVDAHGGTVFARDDGTAQHRSNEKAAKVAKAGRNWTAAADHYGMTVTDDQVKGMADKLGVKPEALRAIGIGWKADERCYTFPEKDAGKNTLGINRRFDDGSQRFIKGGHRGLIIPRGIDDLPDPVLIVEGASDTAAALSMGLNAVGRPSNRSGSDQLAKLLEGREVIVVGEWDMKQSGNWPGRDGAFAVAQQLADTWGKPTHWALPPDNAKDVREWLSSSEVDLTDDRTLRAAGQKFVEQLKGVAQQTWPSAQTGGAHGGQPSEWPEPKLLPSIQPEVAPFDFELLPAALRPWIEDISDRVQCPPDYPAVGAMIALASVVGRKITIRPKRYDDWTVVPNLWGVLIGRPGILKTPALLEVLRPLQRLEITAKDAFDSEVGLREAEKVVARERKEALRRKVRKALDKDLTTDSLLQDLAELDEAAEPTRRRFIVNDSTVEKLGELLNENPDGFLIYRDELIGLLKSLDREGQEGARAFYLETWNGMGRFTYDRIGRGTIDVEACVLSIVGSIQPGPLNQYLLAVTRDGAGNDGLVQRFQLAVWPVTPSQWRNVDHFPDTTAKNAAFDVFQRMATLTPDEIRAEVEDGTPPYLRFANDAQDVFNEWRGDLERRLRAGEHVPAFEDHLAKFRSLIPSLALLIHLADGWQGPVGIASLKRAIGWGQYLESHARKIYAAVVNPDLSAAHALAKHIVNGDLKTVFTPREAYHKGWVGVTTREDVLTAVETLQDLGWLVEIRKETGGRPSLQYWINPRLESLALDWASGGFGGSPLGGVKDFSVERNLL